MENTETENTAVRRGEIEARIRELVSGLGAPNSTYGDWKVIKCYEASLAGQELPYNITELMETRQAVRDEINTLQTELETLEENEVTQSA